LGFEALLHCSSLVDPPPPAVSACQIVPINLPCNSGKTCHLPPKVTELGIGPRTLIKNIPARTQQWKSPVEDWVRDHKV
jgi:hypothetical protein